MRLLLTILLIGLPLAEIATFVQVGQWLGLGPTLALVLLAGLAGILLIRHQSLATLGAVRAALARNQVPAAELADAACVLIAGFLLILPGFISDIVAILLLVRPLRRAIFRWIGWRGPVASPLRIEPLAHDALDLWCRLRHPAPPYPRRGALNRPAPTPSPS